MADVSLARRSAGSMRQPIGMRQEVRGYAGDIWRQVEISLVSHRDSSPAVTMKSKKQRSRCVQPEECGVWLDTTDLKKRSYQTVIPSSYSSKFNPPLRRQHFDSASFEFTQTKTPQLCTKQTSMFAFFTPKGKPKSSNQENEPSSLSVARNAEENHANVSNTGSSVNHEDEPSAYETIIPLNSYGDTPHSEQLWKEIVDDCSNGTDDLVHPREPLRSHSAGSENILCSSADISISDTTKQNSVSCLDSSITSLYSKRQNKDLYTESQLHSQLFTQDSQGNRVIAHRPASDKQKTRYPSGPLQDKTNVPMDNFSPMKRNRQHQCDEDSMRCIFTQDSEGNMVIKH